MGFGTFFEIEPMGNVQNKTKPGQQSLTIRRPGRFAEGSAKLNNRNEK